MSEAVHLGGGFVRDAGWLRAARLVRWLAWASLAWMTVEGAVGLTAGVRPGCAGKGVVELDGHHLLGEGHRDVGEGGVDAFALG